MHTIFAPYKPSPAAASPLGLGKKSDHERQVGAAVARAKAATTKRASRQADPVAKPKRAPGAHPAPKLGRVLTEGVSPMAMAVFTVATNGCRWPLDDGEFRFCGARAVASKSGGLTLKSFCAEHAVLAYRGQARVVTSEMEAA